MPNPYLRGNFAPVLEERSDDLELPVTGVIPPDLDGRLLRNGPNPAVIPADEADYHWFSGDGMVHAISLAGSKATGYRNRWVRTRALAAKVGTATTEGPAEPVDGPANTHVIRHAGTTLALVESGFPHALSPDLGRARVHDFDGALASPMTAHPKVDPDTGELVFFGSDVFGPPFLRYHVADAAGALVRTEEIDLPRATMMHDFGVTATRVVFLDLPVVFDLELAAAGRSIPYRWMPEAGARIGVMPRTGEAATSAGSASTRVYVFHVLNCFDDGDRVVMDVIRYDTAFDTAPGEVIAWTRRRWPAGRSTWRPAGSPSSASTTPRSSSPGSTTPWPGGRTATATAPGSATVPTSPPPRTGQVRPGPRRVHPVRPGRAPSPPGSRCSSRPPTAGARTRAGSSPWSTTPPGTPATWSSSTPPRSPAHRWPPSTSRPGSRSDSTGRGCPRTGEPGSPTRSDTSLRPWSWETVPSPRTRLVCAGRSHRRSRVPTQSPRATL